MRMPEPNIRAARVCYRDVERSCARGQVMAKRFQRITSGKKIAGVCTGLADYFNLDVTLIRVLFIVLCAAYGATLLAYLILWMVAPVAPGEAAPPRE